MLFSEAQATEFQSRWHIFVIIQKGKHQNEPCYYFFFIIILRKGILHLRCIDKGSSASGELLMQVCGWKRLTVDELLWSDRMNLRSYVPERRPAYRLFRWIITHTLGTSRAVQTMKSVISSKNIPFMFFSYKWKCKLFILSSTFITVRKYVCNHTECKLSTERRHS